MNLKKKVIWNLLSYLAQSHLAEKSAHTNTSAHRNTAQGRLPEVWLSHNLLDVITKQVTSCVTGKRLNVTGLTISPSFYEAQALPNMKTSS